MNTLWQYRSIFFAVAVAAVYLLLIRPRLKAGVRRKEEEGPVYVCDQCEEMDCDCRKVEDTKEP